MLLFKLTVIVFGLFLRFCSIHSAGSAGEQGTLFVTLVIKSGARNPTWAVPSDHPKFQNLKQRLDEARAHNFTNKPEEMPSKLGYKGFLVSEGTKESRELILRPETVGLQKLLLETCPEEVLPRESQTRVLVAIDVNAGIVNAEQNKGNTGPGKAKAEQNKGETGKAEPNKGETGKAEQSQGNVGPGSVKAEENNGNAEAGNVKAEENNGNTGAGSVKAEENNGNTGAGNVKAEENNVNTGAGNVKAEKNNGNTGAGNVKAKENNVNTGADSVKAEQKQWKFWQS